MLSTIRLAVEELNGQIDETVFLKIKESVISSLRRIDQEKIKPSLDLSGGLDSGVLLGVSQSNGIPFYAVNSLISPGVLDIELSNIKRWIEVLPHGVNQIEILPTSEEFGSIILDANFVNVESVGILHIDKLAQAASAANSNLRIIGYGPDEFMTHPVSIKLVKLLTTEILNPRHRKQLKNQLYRFLCHLPLPRFLLSPLVNKTIPIWYSDWVRETLVQSKLDIYRYQRNIDYQSELGNRQYKTEFYQSRNLQLPLNDELSLKYGVSCYFPYLDENFVQLSHSLAVRRCLSRGQDIKFGFRQLMNDVLPETMQGDPQNEDFSNFNQLLFEQLANTNEEYLELYKQGFIDKKRFKDCAVENKIPANALARLHFHEKFLCSI